MHQLYTKVPKLFYKTLIIGMISLSHLSGQSSIDNRIFFSGSELVADVLPGNDIFFNFQCTKGIRIYNLAEVFQIKAEKILAINQLNPNQPINDGRIVKIPLKPENILQTVPKAVKNKHFLPIFYITKKGDTAFRIAKNYFRSDVSTLLSLNRKSDETIKIGEKLLIGYTSMPIQTLANDDIPKKQKEDIRHQPEIKPETIALKDIKRPESTGIIKYHLSDVIGWWDKTSKDEENYFVLHNEARPGSMMDIYNPMMKKHIKAKVISSIPASTYADDISIIISPGIAKDLCILDTRYKVNIKYEK
jgi:LysM repeat protein